MNIRTAILKAADSIEQNPHLFDFDSILVPDCGSSGCLIGWIAAHSGLEYQPFVGSQGLGKYWILGGAKIFDLIGVKEYELYDRMNLLGANWRDDALECAKALRLYADKYHPEESVIPESVMAIFNPEVCDVGIG